MIGYGLKFSLDWVLRIYNAIKEFKWEIHLVSELKRISGIMRSFSRYEPDLFGG